MGIITTVAEATGAGTDMAYTKDKDRRTRGVGAIASLDHALPNRQLQYRRMLEDTKRHDRAMAAVTRGALGSVRDPIVTAAQRAVFARTGSTHVPVPTGPRPRPVAPTPTPKSGVVIHDYRTGSGPGTEATGGVWAGLNRLNEKLVKAVALPPATPAAPAPTAPTTPTTPATPAPTTTTSSGGGGGGGGRTPGPATSGPAVDPLPALPDVPAAADEDHTTRNLLIAGGAAVAAYLLFIRGRQ